MADGAVGQRDHAARLRGAELLTGPAVGELLQAALATAGRRLDDWSLRAVHGRGRSVSVLFDVTTADGSEDLLVVHVAENEVPAGTVELTAGGLRVHVWRYPDDPYLPGLPSATSPIRVRELLDGLGLAPGRVRLRARTYRPTRRAVVEVTVVGPRGTTSALFLKVLGGRTRERVERRTRELALPHRALRDAGLPVPGVLGIAEQQGIVALTAVAGRTLRGVLADVSVPQPDPAPILELITRLSAVPLETAGDPRRFAAAARHAPELVRAVPDLAGVIEEVAAAADGAGGPEGTVHGDLHDGQLLVLDGRMTGLLDVDGAGTGLLAHDAGRLVAYVDSLRERGGEVAERGDRLARELFAGFAERIGDDHLRRAVAGARLSMATAPGRSRGDGWRDQTRDRIREAAAWLER